MLCLPFHLAQAADTVYAATFGGGLSISTDGGANFSNKTNANGLGNNSVFGVVVVASPTAPTGLTATATSATQINLSWTDASADETGFKIYQGGTLIHTTTANVTSYSVTGLTCNTGYDFEVKATNANGDSVAAATTPATTTTSACGGGSTPIPASLLNLDQPVIIYSEEINVTE